MTLEILLDSLRSTTTDARRARDYAEFVEDKETHTALRLIHDSLITQQQSLQAIIAKRNSV